MKMKLLAKVAYEHYEATGTPLDTNLKLNIRKVKKLLVAFEELVDKRQILDNIVTANIYFDPASDHNSSFETTNRVIMTFCMDFEDGGD